MQPIPWRLLGAACLGLLALAPMGARAEDEPKGEPAPPAMQLAHVKADPIGTATRIARRAAEAAAAGRFEGALADWQMLVRQHARIPISLHDAGLLREDPDAAGLHWPAARVANRLLAGLDPALRTRYESEVSPITDDLWAHTRRGDVRAREQLRTCYGATRSGALALVLSAELAAERAAPATAAEYFREWLTLAPPGTAPAARAHVVRRLADMLALVPDAGGVRQLVRAHAALLSVQVRTSDGPMRLQDHLETLEALRRERRRAGPRQVAPALAEPALIWSASVQSPAWQSSPAGVPDIVRAGAWTDGNRWLVVHDGHGVRGLDLATGVQRWRFPRTLQAPVHHVGERYAPHARPSHAVVASGTQIFVVLGDPPASGSYTFHGERIPTPGQARETRTRLVALDLETGRLLWATGLAADEHPLLGAPDVGCISPPLVVDDRVYAIFCRLVGLEVHAVCLDRTSGTPLWTRLIGSGESGRDPNRADQARLQSRYVDGLPWAAQPALAGGELCAMTHAGMVAGLDAHSGTLRWVRALPRFPYARVAALAASAEDGHSARNVPMPYGDAWILAPLDCPALVSVARGSGTLRWIRSAPNPELTGGPPWRHLLGAGPDADGNMRLRLSGDMPTLVDPDEGELWNDPAHVRWERDWNLLRVPPAGRPWSDADVVMVARGGHLQVAPWVPDAHADAEVQTLVPLRGRGAPHGGTVLRVHDRVVVVGPSRVGVFDLSGDGDKHLRAPTDPAADVVARAMRASAARDAKALSAVREAYVGLIATEARQAAPRLAEVLQASLHSRADFEPLDAAWLKAVEQAAYWLPPVVRARVWRDLLIALESSERIEEAFELARTWVESGDRALVETDERNGAGPSWIRADLLAAKTLHMLRAHDTLSESLARREAHWEQTLERADGDPRMLQWIAERGRDTRAARSAREALAKLAWKRGHWVEAAAWLSELRAEARRPLRAPAATLPQIARWQLDEAIARGNAGQEIEARNLAAELERWMPEGVTSTDGRALRTVQIALQRRFAWHPERGGTDLDVWPNAEPTKDEVRSVEWLALDGPGVSQWRGLALLVRGFTPEIWSLENRERVGSLPVDDAWFGGTFHSAEEWVPGGGVLVASVVAGEPADRSGIQANDWIRSFDEEPVRSLDTFLRQVAAARPGRTVPIEVRRAGAAVLSVFRPGARPARHGRAMDYQPVWVGGDGRALLPTRGGIVAITARPPQHTPFWTWSGDGVVRRLDVQGDTAFVTVRRRLQGDSVIAVDVQTGRERWRRQVAGRAMRVQVTGSAVAVHVHDPRQVYVLDRWDGSVRARQRCFEPYHHEYPRHLEIRHVSSAGLGRVAMVIGDPHDARLALLDVASGAIEWTGERNNRFGTRMSPHVSVGAFVASIQSLIEIRIVIPEPLGPPRVLRMDKKLLLTEQRHHGNIDNDTRFTVRGRRMFLVRIPGGGTQPIRPSVFEIDERALLSRPRSDTPQRAGGAITYRTDMPLLGGDLADDRYVIDEVAAFDGLLLFTARMGAEERVEAGWLHAEPIRGPDLLRETNGSLSLHDDLALEVRRHAPRRAGNVLLVPTDRGARVVPVRSVR